MQCGGGRAGGTCAAWQAAQGDGGRRFVRVKVHSALPALRSIACEGSNALVQPAFPAQDCGGGGGVESTCAARQAAREDGDRQFVQGGCDVGRWVDGPVGGGEV
jgi:hypothetical protein